MKEPPKEKIIPEAKKLERPRRARSEVVLVKPAERVSYAAFLKELRKHVKPVELSVIIHGIRKRRSKDLLGKLEYSKEDRGWPDSAIKEIIIGSRSVRHLISKIEVEIANIEPSTEAKDVEGTVSGFVDHGSEVKLKVPLTKRPFRGNSKAYVLLEETRVLKLLKVAHINP